MTKFEEEFKGICEKVKDKFPDTEFYALPNVEDVIEHFKDWQPQQALPVVPECVGKMVEYAKKTKKSIRWFFTEDAYMFPEAMDWYAGNVQGSVDDIYGERQSLLINAFITGEYEVEKPQFFYLKHIDMSKLDKECDWYLITDCVRLCHDWVVKSLKPEDDDFKFTQQEINGMQTGSYEQIEVAE